MKQQQRIRFSGDVASHKNGTEEHAIKKVVTMARTMLMHDVIKFTDDTLSTDLCPMTMDYVVWVYNQIPYMQSGLSAI